MIGIINADMFGTEAEAGEYVDWRTHDVDTVEGWEALVGDLDLYAANNPHMIVFEVAP